MIDFGRYNLLLKLGQGGMGAVYLARQKTLRRFCAVKVISPQYSQDKEAADRFLREARATAALTHSNLVSIFDCDKFEGQYFIAMEYVEGLSLGEILRNHGPIPLPLALYWLNQATVGLEYIHRKNIIHRDIKPDNMIVDATGNLKIMDLGLAKDHFEADQGMTVTGTVMGSPHYMSPEQINDSKTVDHRTDLYSLGISLYQMVVGNVPFRQTSAAAVCVAHLQEPIPSVELADSELSQALDGLIMHITAKNKDERIQSATDLVAVLQPWITNYPMDEASQESFSKLGFEHRKVAYLLEKEGIDQAQIDADLAPLAVENLPTQAAPASPTTTPPFQTAVAPSRFPFKWLAVGAATILLLLFLAKVNRKNRPSLQPVQVAKLSAETAPAAAPDVPPPLEPEKPKVGGLLVTTQPDKAIVLFRSKSQTSPAEFKNIPVGKYPVKVMLPHHKEVEQMVEIREDNVVPLDLILNKIQASAKIETSPAGAEVIVNGVSRGKTPLKLDGGEGENIGCKLQLEGYEEALLHVSYTNGTQTVTLVAMAKPKPYPQPIDMHDGRENNNQPMTPQPGSKMAKGMQYMELALDQARAASDQQWPDLKGEILSRFEDEIKRRNSKDSAASQQAIPQLGKILDSARLVSNGDFETQKNGVVREMMMIMGKAMGRPPPDDDGGNQGSGSTSSGSGNQWGRGGGGGGGDKHKRRLR